MPVRYTFIKADGTAQDPQADLSPVQQAFLSLSQMGIGIARLNRSTIDEFVRRADLMQTYVGTVWTNGDGSPRVFTRADFMELMPQANTNWSTIGKQAFDKLMEKPIADRWNEEVYGKS